MTTQHGLAASPGPTQPGLFDEGETSADTSFATARVIRLDDTSWKTVPAGLEALLPKQKTPAGPRISLNFTSRQQA